MRNGSDRRCEPCGPRQARKEPKPGGVAIPRVRRRLREFRGEPLAGDSRERRRLIQPATGVLGLNRTRRGRVILGTIDCAHVVAGAVGVLHLVAGAAHRGNHAVIAQHLVAHAALTNAGPRELIGRTISTGRKVRGSSRGSHVASREAGKAHGTLLTVSTQRAVDVAAHPQVAARIHEGLPPP